MPEKKKPLDQFTVAAIVLILLAVLYFVYIFLMGMKAPATSFNHNLGQFKLVNSATIQAIRELDACGSWPIVTANLSAGRGNPFSRQGQKLPQMTATSSVICLPVTQ